MGFLIVSVRPAAQVDSIEHRDAEPLLKLSVRSQLGNDFIGGEGWTKFEALMRKHGFKVLHPLEHYKPQEWPLTAVAYTSHDKKGAGRSGSSLFRLACRVLTGSVDRP